MLEARANRFSGHGGLSVSRAATKSVCDEEKASNSFGQYMGTDVIGGRSSSKQLGEKDFEMMTVKGTCRVLEKEYLRLTSPPKASKVRPQHILEQHLVNLKKRWRDGDRDYTWFCSQLKAVRQDLMVQRINNAFTVDAYETHARIALEQGDLNEYNQCQTQLRDLYEIIEKSDDGTMKLKGLKNMVSGRLRALAWFPRPDACVRFLP